MKQTLSTLIAALTFLVVAAVPAAAQSTQGGDDAARVGAGFMLLNWIDSDSTAKGLAVDFSQPVNLGGSRNWSIIGDLLWGKDDDETDFAVGGGVRFTTAAGGRARVYGQAHVGVVRWSISDCCDDSAFYFAPGGGVLFPITDRVDFKGQIDLYLPNWDGYTDKLFRVFLGVSFQVGQR